MDAGRIADIVVYGAGGHGKVVCDVLRSSGCRVVGFVDDDPKMVGASILGLPVFGGSEWLEGNRTSIALGVGANRARARVAEACERLGCRLVIAVHRDATIAPSAVLAPGTVVMARAAINADARVGRGAIVNTGAIVEHDCVLGDFCHVSPNSTMGGGVTIGSFSQLGIGATILPTLSVGEGSVVGGGALVARPIPAGVIARGVPARVTGLCESR